MNLLIRLLINAISLWVTAQFVNGISLEGNIVSILIVALIFGLINAIIRPILTFFTLPAVILTLGLFIFIINALMLWLTSQISSTLTITSFSTAIWGSIIISIVSWLLSIFLKDEEK